MTDGTCTAMITGTNGNYYIAVRQRNSICTWSSAPVALSLSVPASYNFSTSLNQSFGYWMADNYSEGIYSLFSGDINQDEFIDANDYTSFDQDNANGLCCGYFATDLNGDGFVDGSDYPLFDTNNSMGVLSIHP
ncbi:MAG: hypothetical protein IPN88_15005 [Bacteroidetes bacterium]|nr:hypothetical protein [Bacteroidota bacterium]